MPTPKLRPIEIPKDVDNQQRQPGTTVSPNPEKTFEEEKNNSNNSIDGLHTVPTVGELVNFNNSPENKKSEKNMKEDQVRTEAAEANNSPVQSATSPIAIGAPSAVKLEPFRCTIPTLIPAFLRISLMPYAVLVTALFDLFAARRAKDNYDLMALLIVAATLGNIFSSLMFGKNSGLLASTIKQKGKNPLYAAIFVGSFIFAVMAVFASALVARDAVQKWPYLTVPASILLILYTLSSRFWGAINLSFRTIKATRYGELSTISENWEKYGATFLAQEATEENIEIDPNVFLDKFSKYVAHMKSQLSLKQKGLNAAETVVTYGLPIMSLGMLPLWYYMTKSSAMKIHSALGNPAFVGLCAISNPAFYFVSLLDLYPNMKKSFLLLDAYLVDKGFSLAQRVAIHAIVWGPVIALAITSGSGYLQTARDDLHDSGQLAGNLFFEWVLPVISLVSAGLVNLNGTVKLLTDFILFARKPEHADLSNWQKVLLFMDILKKQSTPVVASESVDARPEIAINDDVPTAKETIQRVAADAKSALADNDLGKLREVKKQHAGLFRSAAPTDALSSALLNDNKYIQHYGYGAVK